MPESDKKLVPGYGVYLVSLHIRDQDLFGMMNIGTRPTVTNGITQTIEVYVLNFQGDLYGDRISIRFLRKLRDEQKFASAAELKEQLDRDRERSLAVIRELTGTIV
jgi:FAD synthase